MAVGRNPERPANAVYHSDRGCQYTAKKPKRWLKNAVSEKACHARKLQATISHSRVVSRVLVKYFEIYYNSDRLHSGIGYLTPNECFAKLTL